MAPTPIAGRRCDHCGGVVVYKPGHPATECRFCGTLAPIDVAPGRRVVERDYHTARTTAPTGPAAEIAMGGREIACQTCGARAIVTVHATRCAFCDAAVVVEIPHADDRRQILPETVLPFAVDAPAARAAFRAWMKSRWFAPSDLVYRSRIGGLDGVYLPYWSYDSRTTTHYRGERGDDYTERERTWDHGEWKDRQVTRTAWSSAAGTVAVDFDDVLVCASQSVPQQLVDRLEPWDLPSLQPFDDRYLAGFIAERYAIDLEQGFTLAERKMMPRIHQRIDRDIGGDRQRIHWTEVHHAGVMFKHALMPLWISAFRYQGKVFRVTVNARTGAVSGERPWSSGKIAALAILLGAIAFAIALWWYRR